MQREYNWNRCREAHIERFRRQRLRKLLPADTCALDGWALAKTDRRPVYCNQDQRITINSREPVADGGRDKPKTNASDRTRSNELS